MYRLDVDRKTAAKDVLLGKKGEEARREAYRRLQALIAKKPAKRRI